MPRASYVTLHGNNDEFDELPVVTPPQVSDEPPLDADEIEMLDGVKRRNPWFCAPLSCDPRQAHWPLRFALLFAGLVFTTLFFVFLQQSVVRCRQHENLCFLPWPNAHDGSLNATNATLGHADNYAGYAVPVWLIFVFIQGGAYCFLLGIVGVTVFFAKKRTTPQLGQTLLPLAIGLLLSNVLRLTAFCFGQLALLAVPMYLSRVGLTPISYGIIAMPLSYRLFQMVLRMFSKLMRECKRVIGEKTRKIRRGSLSQLPGARRANAYFNNDDDDDDGTQLVRIVSKRSSRSAVASVVVDRELRAEARRASRRTNSSIRWSMWLTLLLLTMNISMLVRSVDNYGPDTPAQGAYFMAIGISMFSVVLWTLGDAVHAHITDASPIQIAHPWLRFGAASLTAILFGLLMALVSTLVLVVVYVPSIQTHGIFFDLIVQPNETYFFTGVNVTQLLGFLAGLVFFTQVFVYKFAHGTQWVFVVLFSVWTMILVSKGLPPTW